MTPKKDYSNLQKRFYPFEYSESQAFGFEKLFMPDPVPYRLT